MMDKGRTKIIFFFIILIIFSFQKAFANSQFLSKQCKKELNNWGIKNPNYNLFKPIEEDYIYLPITLKRKGTKDVQIKNVSFTPPDLQTIYGLKFIWNNQSIIDCRSFWHTPMISLMEEYEDYDSVLGKTIDAVKISTLYFVNCGSPCHLSEVKSTIITKNWNFTPHVIDEISSPVFEYPSQWFADYLTLEELFQFMGTENGFENFKWRGKTYNTEELRKKYAKK